MRNDGAKQDPDSTTATAGGLSRRALSTPEPYVRLFSRRVQQEGALDLTQGDYKNADFAPHPEVVRAAQRITRNTVHSYGPAVGRMDVRGEVADFFNRDGLLDYPESQVRFLPDEVLFTPGTRSGLAMVLEVLGADGSGVVVPRPSWEYDWYVERAGKTLVELPTSPPDFLPDPKDLDRLLAKGGISSVILNNPHNPTGRVYPRALVEELVRVAVKHRVYVLYDSVYQRLDYVGWFVNPAFADPEWRDWVVSLSGLSKMDMFGASTGTRACWMVISDQIRSNGVRAREILANLSAWLVATPSTLAQDWALAALQSPLAALRRPSPYMRERRDFMAKAADELAPLGVERTDFGGTFYAPLAFPGLVGEPFDRLRNGVREKAVVKDSVDAFELLLSGGVGGIPFVAFAGSDAARYGTWQRLSYGSKDVKELSVFIDRVKARLAQQGRLGSSAPGCAAPRRRAGHDRLAGRPSTRSGRASARPTGTTPSTASTRRPSRPPGRAFLADPRHETLRLTGTKHPDSTAHRAEQLDRALRAAPAGDARPRAPRPEAPRVEPARRRAARVRGDDRRPARSVQRGPPRLRGAADQPRVARPAREGRPRAPAPRRSSRARTATSSSASRTPSSSRTRRRSSRSSPRSPARTSSSTSRAREVGITPVQNALPELTVPQVNSVAEIGAVVKIGTLYRSAIAGLFAGDGHGDAFLARRVPAERRARARREDLARPPRPALRERRRPRAPPRVPRGVLPRPREGPGLPDLPTPSAFRTRFDRDEAVVRVFVAMSDTAEQSGKIATDAALHARPRRARGGRAAPRDSSRRPPASPRRA